MMLLFSGNRFGGQFYCMPSVIRVWGNQIIAVLAETVAKWKVIVKKIKTNCSKWTQSILISRRSWFITHSNHGGSCDVVISDHTRPQERMPRDGGVVPMSQENVGKETIYTLRAESRHCDQTSRTKAAQVNGGPGAAWWPCQYWDEKQL